MKKTLRYSRIWNLRAYIRAVENGELKDDMATTNLPKAKRQLRYHEKKMEEELE